jgi:hypothetical protein
MTALPNVIAFRALPATESLRRPSLLIRAARAGQSGWRRERDLPRLLRSDRYPQPGAALPRLRAEEAQMNAARKEGAADYDLQRHVLLMIAILAEMRSALAEHPAPGADIAPVSKAGQSAALSVLTAAISARGTVSPAHP